MKWGMASWRGERAGRWQRRGCREALRRETDHFLIAELHIRMVLGFFFFKTPFKKFVIKITKKNLFNRALNKNALL